MSIPQPIGYIRSNWSNDQHTHGSYSFIPTGGTPTDRVTLRQPLGSDKVFFAGEHTSVEYPATVHGAWQTGEVAAKQIIEETNKANGGKERVVIIGAGVAGLTAARLLHDKGNYDVTVLESRDRIGGRCHTLKDPEGFDNIGKLTIEMGCNWVQNHENPDGGKPLYDKMHELGARVVEFDWEKYRIWNVKENADVDLVDMELKGDEALANADEWAKKQKEDVSYLTALRAVTPLKPNPSIIRRFTLEYGASLSELSARHGHEGGVDGPFVLGGYGRLPTALAEGMDVKLECAVSNIILGQDNRVQVVTDAATIIADRVIVAVPLPVIQKEVIKFTPPMPELQKAAWNRLAMGTLDKIWLRFAEPFWESMDISWDSIENPTDNQWMWCNMMSITGEPVLLGLVGGDQARKIGKMTDEDVLALALTNLKTFKDAQF